MKNPNNSHVFTAAACFITMALNCCSHVQVSVNVCVFIFDLLMVDGEPLLKSTLRDRRSRVAKALPHMTPGFIQLAESIQLQSPSQDAVEPHQVPFAHTFAVNGYTVDVRIVQSSSFTVVTSAKGV